MMEEALVHLDEAVAFIKGVAPDVWAVYLRQQVIEGWARIIAPLLGLTISLGWLWKCWDAGPGTKAFKNDELAAFGWLFGAFGSSIMTLVSVLLVPGGILRVLNPTYYAIKELLP